MIETNSHTSARDLQTQFVGGIIDNNHAFQIFEIRLHVVTYRRIYMCLFLPYHYSGHLCQKKPRPNN